MTTVDPSAVPAIQARTLRTLMGSQVLGGVGVASGIAVGALLAVEVSGDESLSGLANTTQVLGAALFTAPVAALMAVRGRRAGLVAAYAVGTVGAFVAIAATVVGSFLMLLAGTAMFGAATTANAQARYAAADLAEPAHRGRQLSLVLWATTIGSVLGPNLIGPGKWVARLLGVPELTGALVFSALGFAVAGIVLTAFLRPDPLLTARALSEAPATGPALDPAVAPAVPAGPALAARPEAGRALRPVRRSVLEGARIIRRNPPALLGTAAITGGHVVMVAVMVMTPVHMQHGHAEVEVIGLVISVHILGMYGLSPVVGALTDRLGAPNVVVVGVVTQLLACLLAGLTDAGWSPLLMAGLFLLGVGWSCTMVAGSGLLAGAVPPADRSVVQGAADIVMGLSAAAGGAVAGVVLGVLGYGWLCLLAAIVALALGVGTMSARRMVSLTP